MHVLIDSGTRVVCLWLMWIKFVSLGGVWAHSSASDVLLSVWLMNLLLAVWSEGIGSPWEPPGPSPLPGLCPLQSCSIAEAVHALGECCCNLFCCFLQPLGSQDLTLEHELLLCWAPVHRNNKELLKERVEFKGLLLNVCITMSCCGYYNNCTSITSWGCCLKDMMGLQICLELHILGFGFPNDWLVMIYPYDPLSHKIVCNNHFYTPFLYGPAGFSSWLVGRPGF